MASEAADSGRVTLINVFEVEQCNVDAFLTSWRERAEFMSSQPGFRSLRLHRAVSQGARFQLINVAEWDSAEALQAASSREEFQASAQESVERYGVIAHPGVYHVALEVDE
ncbi:MAG: antibiotic biosynthesis monooxygenase, partial [Mycobacteriaceae bacterium]|nr:antibiotic biosynthesis monooxygenase [Mycobacteriaceae bacterium]